MSASTRSIRSSSTVIRRCLLTVVLATGLSAAAVAQNIRSHYVSKAEADGTIYHTLPCTLFEHDGAGDLTFDITYKEHRDGLATINFTCFMECATPIDSVRFVAGARPLSGPAGESFPAPAPQRWRPPPPLPAPGPPPPSPLLPLPLPLPLPVHRRHLPHPPHPAGARQPHPHRIHARGLGRGRWRAAGRDAAGIFGAPQGDPHRRGARVLRAACCGAVRGRCRAGRGLRAQGGTGGKGRIRIGGAVRCGKSRRRDPSWRSVAVRRKPSLGGWPEWLSPGTFAEAVCR